MARMDSRARTSWSKVNAERTPPRWLMYEQAAPDRPVDHSPDDIKPDRIDGHGPIGSGCIEREILPDPGTARRSRNNQLQALENIPGAVTGTANGDLRAAIMAIAQARIGYSSCHFRFELDGIVQTIAGGIAVFSLPLERERLHRVPQSYQRAT